MHLRLCLTCGHVGCCDNSPSKHATKHYRATHHPIIRSFEPGEAWAYCYPADLFFEQVPARRAAGALRGQHPSVDFPGKG